MPIDEGIATSSGTTSDSSDRDPAVARRVQILHIYPGFLPRVITPRNLEPPQLAPVEFEVKLPHTKRSPHALSRFIDSTKAILEPGSHRTVNKLRKARPGSVNKEPRLTADEKHFENHDTGIGEAQYLIRILSDVLSNLPNVTSYYVTWHGLSDVACSPASMVVSAMTPHLQRLSLDICLGNIPSILSSDLTLPNLVELTLCIHTDGLEECSHILHSHVAPAINRLGKSLQTLAISSWEPADLSPLFSNINGLSSLRELRVGIPVEECHLGEPVAFGEFIARHQTSLHTLQLAATQHGGIGLTPDESRIHNWITHAIESVDQPILRVLEISSSLFPIQTSLACIRHFPTWLTSVSITGAYWSLGDVEDALVALQDNLEGARLKRLRIGPVSLSAELVDVIATRCQKLTFLELLVSDFYTPTVEGNESKRWDDAARSEGDELRAHGQEVIQQTETNEPEAVVSPSL